MAAIAEQDNSALIQTILGAISGKSGTTKTTGTQTGTTTGNTSTTGSQSGSTNTSGGTTTSGSSTTKSDISAEGIAKMLQDALSASGSGIADIATGGKVAGLYNSSTQQLLTNDLLSRTAGELAKLQAGTTTTTTGSTNQNQTQTTNQNTTNNTATNQQNTQNNNQTVVSDQESPLKNVDLGALLGAGGLAAGGSILLPVLQGLIGKVPGGQNGLGGIGQQLANLIFGGGGGNGGISVDPNGQGTNNSGLTPQQIEQLMGSGSMDWFNDFLSDIGLNDGGSPIDNSGDDGSWWDLVNYEDW